MGQLSHEFFSQYGEDKLLYKLFDERDNGFCIEVGGYDGITGSTTLFFERLGWKCLLIEPMSDYCDKIKQFRNCELVQAAASDENGEAIFHVAKGVETLSTLEQDESHLGRVQWEGGQLKEIKVQKLKLDDILSNLKIKEIDFMTIDVEGHEMAALRGLSLQTYQPRVIIIEDNSHGLNRNVKNHLKKFGYVRINITGCNDWYAKENDKRLVTPIRIFAIEVKSFLKIIESAVKAFVIKLLPKQKIDLLVKLFK